MPTRQPRVPSAPSARQPHQAAHGFDAFHGPRNLCFSLASLRLGGAQPVRTLSLNLYCGPLQRQACRCDSRMFPLPPPRANHIKQHTASKRSVDLATLVYPPRLCASAVPNRRLYCGAPLQRQACRCDSRTFPLPPPRAHHIKQHTASKRSVDLATFVFPPRLCASAVPNRSRPGWIADPVETRAL